jgi:hypothetical protein
MTRERPDRRQGGDVDRDGEHVVPDGRRSRVQALQRSLGNDGINRLRAAMKRDAVQRRGGGDAHEADADLDVGSGGRPLTPAVQRRAEAALGVPLHDVRVVAGADAACRAADAVAFTRHEGGVPTVALSSAVDPDTSDGAFTLMHELGHVAQQKRGEADGLEGLGGDPGLRSSLEADADQRAATILGGG